MFWTLINYLGLIIRKEKIAVYSYAYMTADKYLYTFYSNI